MDFTEVSLAQLFARIVSRGSYFTITWIHGIRLGFYDFKILDPF